MHSISHEITHRGIKHHHTHIHSHLRSSQPHTIIPVCLRRVCVYVHRGCVYVHRGCVYVHRGCVYVHRGCVYVHRGCVYVHRGCVYVHRGCVYLRDTNLCVVLLPLLAVGVALIPPPLYTPPLPHTPPTYSYITRNISFARRFTGSPNTPILALTARKRGSGYMTMLSGASNSSDVTRGYLVWVHGMSVE